MSLFVLFSLAMSRSQEPVSILPVNSAFHLRGATDMIRGEGGVGKARFDVLKKGDAPYACEVTSAPSAVAIQKGETIYITYEARCAAAKNESQTGNWNLRVQRPSEPYDGPSDTSGSAGKAWRRFHAAFRADKDYAAGQLVVTFHVATAVQSLEFRDFKWLNYGAKVDPLSFPANKLSYGGQEPDAPWRAKAAAMIEKNRKSDIVIQTTPGAKVHIKMLRHAYPFATVTGVDPSRTDTDARKFFAFMKANYSRVTVPIYWTDWGWESTESREKYLRNIRWCLANGYRMKGHNIIWPSYKWTPARLKDLSNADLAREITKSFDERIAALKSVPFETVDVVNELVSEHDFEDKLGLGFAVEAFKKSRVAWPKADLVYNDYLVQDGDGVNPKFIDHAKKLQTMGAPITLLGYQAHFGESLPAIPWLWTLLDTAKRTTGLPVEITEFDLNTRDDAAQAEFTRDIVTAWFAHPQSRGFTMWGFWEGDHWIPSSAMIRKDWTLRPAAQVWHELITKTWWTDVTVVADGHGLARMRGFKGDYEISAKAKSKKAFLGDSTLTIKL